MQNIQTRHTENDISIIRRRQRGQATTEYALILLVAAVVAIGVIAWATAGGGAGKIGSLFDSILDAVLSRAESTF